MLLCILILVIRILLVIMVYLNIIYLTVVLYDFGMVSKIFHTVGCSRFVKTAVRKVCRSTL